MIKSALVLNNLMEAINSSKKIWIANYALSRNVLGVELPNTVELAVVETEPGIKGDTASGGTKPATLETGVVVQVPFFY